jgi:hypothetical protein
LSLQQNFRLKPVEWEDKEMIGEFIRPAEVSELTGLSLGALAELRFEGKGPRFYKPSAHRVLYKREEVIAWLESTVQTPSGVPA